MSFSAQAMLFMAFQVADVATTWLGLAAGFPEANPLGAFVMAQVGQGGAFLVKLGLVSLVPLVVALAARRGARRVAWALPIATAIQCLVVTTNVGALLGIL